MVKPARELAAQRCTLLLIAIRASAIIPGTASFIDFVRS